MMNEKKEKIMGLDSVVSFGAVLLTCLIGLFFSQSQENLEACVLSLFVSQIFNLAILWELRRKTGG
jgi:hypothetical protein